jgi:hypothetical protein
MSFPIDTSTQPPSEQRLLLRNALAVLAAAFADL